MTAKALIEHIDKILSPLGFERKGSLWNRKVNSTIEVIDIQFSKARDAATMNAGVLESNVYKECWGFEPQKFIEEPFCIVRARIGEIVGDHDIWWSLASTAPNVIIEALNVHVLPFLKNVKTLEAMEEFLSKSTIIRRGHPLPKIYLAILKQRRGDSAAACAILDDIRKKSSGEWSTRATTVADKIGCN